MINELVSPQKLDRAMEASPFSLPVPLKYRFYSEEDSTESLPMHDSSLQLSKSSVSQDPNLWKSKLLSPISQRENDESIADSMKTLSDMSFNQSLKENETPIETWRMSEAITSAKGSFYDNEKPGDGKFSIQFTSFAVPSRIFCSDCEKEVFTVVLTQFIEPNFWDNFEKFFQTFICCDEKGNGKEKQLVHCCSQCRKILARISAGV